MKCLIRLAETKALLKLYENICCINLKMIFVGYEHPFICISVYICVYIYMCLCQLSVYVHNYKQIIYKNVSTKTITTAIGIAIVIPLLTLMLIIRISIVIKTGRGK